MKKKIGLEELGEVVAKGMNIRADIVPVIDKEDEDLLLSDGTIEEEMPVLPVLDQVLLPGVLLPIAAQRPKSRKLLEDAKAGHGHILVFTQMNDVDDPDVADLYGYGVVAKVLKVFTAHNNITVAVLQGITRCCALRLVRTEPYMTGQVILAPESDSGMKSQTFKRNVKRLRSEYIDIVGSRLQDEELGNMIGGIGSDKIFVNFAASHLEVDVAVKYQLLACDSYVERVDRMLEQLKTLKGLEELRREIDGKTQEIIGKQQREYYLRHQLDVIQEELGSDGEGDYIGGNNDVEELKKRADKLNLDKQVREVFDKELRKMRRLSPMTPDYTVQLTYLETLLDVPWHTMADSDFLLTEARRVMDEDHYGIEKVKDRIEEYLAVMKRLQDRGLRSKAQVLCLVGPPGTGKTSVCRSIAKALKRPYRRVALGGLHDEAEIRGHRRTYVGAMPGRIIQEVIKAGVANPVFVLDEIDKVQHGSFNGDPASALLEVLDPEQNCHFHDNYLGIDYDLSNVFFIATANSLAEIHPALLDRMEVIDFSGYILEEKLQIAKQHLLPRIAKENGVDRRQVRFDEKILTTIVNDYTRESGVRQLEKQLSKLVRHRVVRMYFDQKPHAAIREDEVREVLGLPIHNSDRALRMAREGVVTGLAWTPVGGEILFIESSISQGKGTISMTGNLGDVMKESATLAFEYVKANCTTFGIEYSMIEQSNIHIHVPEGATPKDGPSAGVTIFTAIVSALTHRKVLPSVAMTGEITLRGDVTPVGGIKEKVLAARRAGISDIILPAENRRDIEDIKSQYLEGLSFHYVENISQVLPFALEPQVTTAKRKSAKK